MSLLLPVFLGATALVGLPLLLHLLRLQPRKPVPFPSLVFLGREALRDTHRQSLRRWLAFLLRCLLILLIVAAFCRPYWRLERSEASRAVVVVVDNSYSMQAEGRRASVERWLAPQLASLRTPDQLGVLLLHPSPTWLVPLTENLDAGRDALKSLPQAYETSHYRAGLELAGTKLALSHLKQKQILLAADQQRTGWNGVRFDHPLPPGVKLYPAPPAPAPKRQAAITAFRAARSPGGRVAVDVTVRNFSPETDDRTLTVYVGEEKLGMEHRTLEGGRSETIHVDYAVPDATAPLLLHASLDADELTVDDIAYTALAAADDRRVILTPHRTGETIDFLRLALGVTQGAKLPTFRVDPPPPQGAAWPPSSVAVLRGSAPFRGVAATQLDTFLAAGGSAWVICDGSPEQTTWLKARGVSLAPARTTGAGKLKLRDFALDHPLFASFNGHSIAPLLTPVFSRGWAIQGETAEPLARWPDRGIAIAEIPTDGGRLLVTGFGETRADSSFPAEAGFVPLVHQAVIWLAQNPMLAPAGGRISAALALPGAGTWRAILTPRPVPTTEVNGYVTPNVPGIYAFEQPNAPKRYYAINLDTSESDLAPWPTPSDFPRLVNAEKEPAAPAPQATPETPAIPLGDMALVDERQTWWWLLAAAVVVLFLELALANRTVP
jgi:hypothetical protein